MRFVHRGEAVEAPCATRIAARPEAWHWQTATSKLCLMALPPEEWAVTALWSLALETARMAVASPGGSRFRK